MVTIRQPRNESQRSDLGALDLLGQPFVSTELLARVRSALRAWHTLSILEQKAHRDHLTGLANRSALEDHLLRAWYAYERHGDPLAVVILDLDHFKAINDTFGHPTGDEVLRIAARSLANSVRGSDLVARYGGEEFVVVALDCPLSSAVCLAERFRARLAEHAISARGNEIPITVSAGIALADRARQSGPTELLRHADEALYQAKRSGRNAVRVHNSCVGALTEVTGPSLAFHPTRHRFRAIRRSLPPEKPVRVVHLVGLMQVQAIEPSCRRVRRGSS